MNEPDIHPALPIVRHAMRYVEHQYILNKFSANLSGLCGKFLTAKNAEAAKSIIEDDQG